MDTQSRRTFTKEGPDLTKETKLIAVELAVANYTFGEVELQMFPCEHTIPFSNYDRNTFRITIHSSRGDFTMRQVSSW